MTGQMRTTLDAGVGSIAVLQVLLEQRFTHFGDLAGERFGWFGWCRFAGDAGERLTDYSIAAKCGRVAWTLEVLD